MLNIFPTHDLPSNKELIIRYFLTKFKSDQIGSIWKILSHLTVSTSKLSIRFRRQI